MVNALTIIAESERTENVQRVPNLQERAESSG
jgi:hypothetical protein